NVVFQQRPIKLQLIRVVENRASGRNLRRMSLDRVLIESNEYIKPIAVRLHFLFPKSHAQPDVPAPNNRLIAVVSVDVQPEPRRSLCKRIARFIEPISGCAANSYSDFTHG